MERIAVIYLFLLAVFLLISAYFVGFSGLSSSVIGSVNYLGKLFTGQLAPKQTATKKAA